MSGWAVVFPGQGSQSVGMGRAFFDHYALSRLTFEEADDALGYKLSQVIFEGPTARLEETEVQQPAILVVSIAVWRALKHERPHFQPDLALGLSLGEYTAYVAAGSLPFSDAVRLTEVRGRAMQNAVPKGSGGMVAALGLTQHLVEEICQAASEWGLVELANFNAPGQFVISGYVTGLDRAEELIREAGGRAVRLAVSAPFHSRLLEPAGLAVQDALSTIHLARATFPVIANVDAELCWEPEQIVPRLVAQVSHPVRFEDGVRCAQERGAHRFLELGPGKSLSSLIKKIDRSNQTFPIENPEALRKALELV
ncbi:MAG: [acyl-carrier-protein] S-malonyltransferase [Sulfobacillus acidophilus]|uniref:Malonyl CoA-acyl carrier protein transacylase n=1 Tax=Sulfobacillus acidophilus TaxID=53633 RepID=A0A2T2WEP7_9FIRM|nr:MAG: [acyl-carrier-protein] S-malonyltransferase [Sulfobacillus acidophilus]